MQYGYGGTQTSGGSYHIGEDGYNQGEAAGHFGYGGSGGYPVSQNWQGYGSELSLCLAKGAWNGRWSIRLV